MTSVGKIEVKKGHVLIKGTANFGISQRMQGVLCTVGQAVVYEEGSELLEELLGVSISSPQIQRVCRHYGALISKLVSKNCEAVIPRLKIKDREVPVYVMMDGSMVFTRAEKWRELKLGRVFQESQLVEIQKDRKEIMRSLYVSHLGSIHEFFPKLELHLVGYENKVILGDGARWIWNWADDNFPGAQQILDFYHAKEKLVIFAGYQFKEESMKQEWIKKQLDRLLDNQLENVLATLKSCRATNPEAKLAKQKTIDYYTEHDERMQYKSYREQGLLIGSGPIEAAHRSVIQQRMKLSGQKWSINGANAIATLRCYKASQDWNIVKTVIDKSA